MVELSKMRHRVTVESPAGELNAFRQPARGWDAGATIWARVTTLSGRELATAQQVRPETTLRVECRYGAAAIRADDRLDFEGRKLRILAVYDPEERRRVLWIDCAEWKDAGEDA